MEELKRLKGVRCLFDVPTEELEAELKVLRNSQAPEMLICRPTPDDPCYYVMMRAKFAIPEIKDWIYVMDSREADDIWTAVINAKAVRPFVMRVLRKLTPVGETLAKASEDIQPLGILDTPIEDDDGPTFDSLLEDACSTAPAPEPIREEQRFLMQHTPESIARELDKEVIGQPELTRAAADFLYYHVLRQLHPELPPRPLLIAGPSGSGKTEVWRVIQKKYDGLLNIRIVDGSNLTCDGWSGNFKLETFVDNRMAEGGILVVDEFDKLTSPRYSSGGNNVSNDIQSEFLKLMEGEYQLTRNKKLTGQTTKLMGLVLVGAFEQLRGATEQEETTTAHIGFCSQEEAPKEQRRLTDEDLISHGIMPEIVGRIAAKCETKYLTDEVYMDIVCSPYSRVTVLKNVLQSCGVDVEQILSREELQALIRTSRSNRTGVRWVVSQVETRLLESIRHQGLYHQTPGTPGKEPSVA